MQPKPVKNSGYLALIKSQINISADAVEANLRLFKASMRCNIPNASLYHIIKSSKEDALLYWLSHVR